MFPLVGWGGASVSCSSRKACNFVPSLFFWLDQLPNNPTPTLPQLYHLFFLFLNYQHYLQLPHHTPPELLLSYLESIWEANFAVSVALKFMTVLKTFFHPSPSLYLPLRYPYIAFLLLHQSKLVVFILRLPTSGN